jgi:hypothetical protein
MILATTTVENVDRFLEMFGTKGADKRALRRLGEVRVGHLTKPQTALLLGSYGA